MASHRNSENRKSSPPINIPNILTIIRILITPLFVIFLIRKMFSLALLSFAVAGISDGLDGLLARYFDQRTTLGALLDPIADKLLLTTAFISLAVFRLLPPWLTVVVISRDVVIALGVAVFAITNTRFEIKPTLASKLTTVFQVATVCLVLLNTIIPGVSALGTPFFWATAALTIFSGLHYLYIGLNILQGGQPPSADK